MVGYSSDEPAYVKHMSDKISFAEVPRRIIQRYAENFKYLTRQLAAMFESQATTITSVEDTYGFEKTLILLTR